MLEASTAYVLLTANDFFASLWNTTDTLVEDAGGAAGWSITNVSEIFRTSNNAWETIANPRKISVRGTARTPPPPVNPPSGDPTPPVGDPPPPIGVPSSPDTPGTLRARFDKSTLDSLILTFSWASVSDADSATDYEYKVFEGPPTARVFPALIDWTSTGGVLETDILLERVADAYTIWLRAVRGEAKSEHAQIGAYVPADIYSIVLRSGSETPFAFVLSQNYPNPFNPATTIRYELPRASEVRLAVYDLLGREISVLADGLQTQGVHTARFDANGFPSGSYVYRLEAAGKIVTRVMTLSR